MSDLTREARKALRALYAQVPEEVARDVSARIEPALKALDRAQPATYQPESDEEGMVVDYEERGRWALAVAHAKARGDLTAGAAERIYNEVIADTFPTEPEQDAGPGEDDDEIREQQYRAEIVRLIGERSVVEKVTNPHVRLTPWERDLLVSEATRTPSEANEREEMARWRLQKIIDIANAGLHDLTAPASPPPETAGEREPEESEIDRAARLIEGVLAYTNGWRISDGDYRQECRRAARAVLTPEEGDDG